MQRPMAADMGRTFDSTSAMQSSARIVLSNPARAARSALRPPFTTGDGFDPALPPRTSRTLPSNDPSIWRPDVTVAAVVERDGRFLFVEERVRGNLVLNQPAGHLESGESLIEAVCRETLEESAWEIEALALVGIYQWTSPLDGVGFMRFAFAARALRAHERELDTGIERAVWLSAAELAAHPVPSRSPLVGRCVDDYLAGHRHSFDLLRNLDGHLRQRS